MKLFIYCVGGFGKEIMDLARRKNAVENIWDEICFIDDFVKGDKFYGSRLFTFSEVLEKFDRSSLEMLIANAEPSTRKVLFDKIKDAHLKMATLIDSTATVSLTAKIGESVIVSEYCYISSLVVLHDNVALNNNTLVGHDTVIAENSVLSSAVNVGGNCLIGKNTYIGMGTQIKQGTSIGKDVIIGMGSAVHNSIQDGVIAIGNPARPMRRNLDNRVFNK
jgi:sugar O-acyltransferase (sialic acid O-acetyltransferase NeuD family)